jgi:hypothetical protein
MSNDNSPSLDEAFEQASSTLKIDEEQEQTTEPQKSEEVTEEETSKEEESTQTDGDEEKEEAPKEEETEETFTEKKLSFNELPDELKPIYKDWQKQYTQKRQSEKAYIKELEEKLAMKSEQPKQEQDKSVPQGLTPNQLDEYLDIREQNSYIANQEKQFMALDDRLSEDSPEYDPWLYNGVIGELTKAREAYEAKNKTIMGFDFVKEAKEKIKNYDEKLLKKGGEVIKEKTAKTRQVLEKSKKENPRAKSLEGKTSKPMDIDSSIDAAFNKLAS